MYCQRWLGIAIDVCKANKKANGWFPASLRIPIGCNKRKLESWDAYPQLSKCIAQKSQAYSIPSTDKSVCCNLRNKDEQGLKPVNSLHVILLARTCCPRRMKAEPEGIHNMLCLGGLYTLDSASILQVISRPRIEYLIHLIPWPSTGIDPWLFPISIIKCVSTYIKILRITSPSPFSYNPP